MTDQPDQKPDAGTATEVGRAASVAARRRLLKGAAIGLPAIMTLKSGAVLAATSLTCLAKRTPSADQGTSTTEPSNATPVTSSATGADGSNINWVRGQVTEVTVQHVVNGSPVISNALPPARSPDKVYFDSTVNKWRYSSNGTVVPGAGTTSSLSSLDPVYPPQSSNPNDYWTQTPATGYAIGWIDDTGAVRALGPNSTGLPASASCLTSLFPSSSSRLAP